MSEKAKKQDRRTRYTRQTIKDTFLELLKQKSFTKITVTEVCKNAEINRGTFYLHYYDIYDVLSDILNDMTQDMLTTVDHLFCPNQKNKREDIQLKPNAFPFSHTLFSRLE